MNVSSGLPVMKKVFAIALSNARASLAFQVSQECVLTANMLDLAGANT